MWNCVVEYQQQPNSLVDRPIRQVIFNNIYPDKNSIRKKVPIDDSVLQYMKAGAPVAYYDNCGEIREGSFLCTSKQFKQLSPRDIISNVLSTEDEIRNFCRENHIGKKDDHIYQLVIDAFEFLTQKIDELKEASPKPAPPLTQPEVAEPEVDLSHYAPIAPRPGTFLSHVQSQFVQQTPSQIPSSIQTQIPSQIPVPSQSQIPVSAETPESSNFSHGDTIPLSIEKAQNEYQLQYRIDLPQASSIQTEIPQTTQSLQNQDPFPVQQPTLNRKRPAPENEENLNETKQPKKEVEKPEDDDFFIETGENWDTNPEDTENADTVKVELNDSDTEVIDTQTSDSISLDTSEAGSEPGPSTSVAKNISTTARRRSGRNHLTLDMRHYLIVMKETDPDRSLRSLSEEMQRRFGIKVGRTSISRTLKNSDQIKSLMSQMMNSGVGPKGRKRLMSTYQISFENMLHEILFDNHQKWSVTTAIAKAVGEAILQANEGPVRTAMKHVKFGSSYFKAFFNRYSWSWTGIGGRGCYTPNDNGLEFLSQSHLLEPLAKPPFEEMLIIAENEIE